MQERTTDTVGLQAESAKDVLTEILREGAHKMLATAIEAEVDAYIDEHADQRDANGHRLVVRNGHKDERQIQTGIGPVTVRKPRVDDQRIGEKWRGQSRVHCRGFRGFWRGFLRPHWAFSGSLAGLLSDVAGVVVRAWREGTAVVGPAPTAAPGSEAAAPTAPEEPR